MFIMDVIYMMKLDGFGCDVNVYPSTRKKLEGL